MEWRIWTIWWILFCIRYSELFRKHHQEKKLADKLPAQIYANKIHNITTFKIKTGYYIELWTLKNIQLFESNERRITKGKNDEKVSPLEFTEVALTHYNIANNQ